MVVMPRRIAGDSEVLTAAYENVAIDEQVALTGTLSSMLVGIRPDGNYVVVAELSDVTLPAGVSAPPPRQQVLNLEGAWEVGGAARRATITFQRTPIIDDDGAHGYVGALQFRNARRDDPPILKFMYAARNGDVIFCSAPRGVTEANQVTATHAGQCMPIGACLLHADSSTVLSGQCAGLPGLFPPYNMTLTRPRN
jgi:hypothetical protein